MAAIRDHCRLAGSVNHGYRCRLGALNEVSSWMMVYPKLLREHFVWRRLSIMCHGDMGFLSVAEKSLCGTFLILFILVLELCSKIWSRHLELHPDWEQKTQDFLSKLICSLYFSKTASVESGPPVKLDSKSVGNAAETKLTRLIVSRFLFGDWREFNVSI